MFKFDEMMKYSQTFKGMKDCFICIEMKDGGRCERLVGGGYPALIHGVCGIIANLADKTGRSFGEVVDDIEAWNRGVNEMTGGAGFDS